MLVSHRGGLEGGGEICLLEAAEGLTMHGKDVHVVLPSDGAFRSRLDELGICNTVVWNDHWLKEGSPPPRKSRLANLGRNVRAVWRMKQLFTKEQPDVVMTNTLTMPVSAFAAKLANIPHVWYAHEMFGKDRFDVHFNLPIPLTLALIDFLSVRVIAGSDAMRKRLARYIRPHKLHVVYYANRIAPVVGNRTPAPSERFQLLQVGRINEAKGGEDAVRAVAQLRSAGYDVALTLLGSEIQGYGDFLRRLAQELGIAEYITLAPFDEPYAYYTQANVVLLCSRMECFGRVIAEAMKMGKPVIATNRGGIPEQVQPGINGWLYEPGDGAMLAKHIAALYDDRAVAKRMGKQGQEWATRNFNLEKMTNELVGVLSQVARPARLANDVVAA
ncbi:MAG TPA: glycosyltransferase family 4 protein [Anaerolineae bacterium]|nr:glycosyltransferase family 4 protein [Anaerolineae bacterium]